MQAGMTRVFVYGTLKRGQPHHFRLEERMKTGAVQFCGEASTVQKFPLIIANRYNCPYVLLAPGIGHGEVYDVDEDTKRLLDELEDAPHHYQYQDIEVELRGDDTRGQQITTCLVYGVKNFRPEMLEKPFMESYSARGSHGLDFCFDAVYNEGTENFRYEVIQRPNDN